MSKFWLILTVVFMFFSSSAFADNHMRENSEAVGTAIGTAIGKGISSVASFFKDVKTGINSAMEKAGESAPASETAPIAVNSSLSDPLTRVYAKFIATQEPAIVETAELKSLASAQQ